MPSIVLICELIDKMSNNMETKHINSTRDHNMAVNWQIVDIKFSTLDLYKKIMMTEDFQYRIGKS